MRPVEESSFLRMHYKLEEFINRVIILYCVHVYLFKGVTQLGFFFFLKSFIYLFIYLLFLAVLGLRFCATAFSSCGKRGPLFITVRGPLTIVASLVAEHRLQMRRLSSCGSWAQLLRGMWDLPRPGLEPVSPALAGRFSSTAPPGKLSVRFQYRISLMRESRQAHKGHEQYLPYSWLFFLALTTMLVT